MSKSSKIWILVRHFSQQVHYLDIHIPKYLKHLLSSYFQKSIKFGNLDPEYLRNPRYLGHPQSRCFQKIHLFGNTNPIYLGNFLFGCFQKLIYLEGCIWNLRFISLFKMHLNHPCHIFVLPTCHIIIPCQHVESFGHVSMAC